MLISLQQTVSQPEWQADKALESVMHGQCARPTVTFPAAGHHRPLTGTKLYGLVSKARVNNLPKVVT